MPRQTSQDVSALLGRIHAEWEAHTNRHRIGRGWGTFRSLVSVMQAAGTLLLVLGLLVQFPVVLIPLRQDTWVFQFVPSLAELAILALFVVPEWLDVHFFGRADRVLRSYGVMKRVDTDPSPLPALSAGALQFLWTGQLLSRLANLAVHVIFAVMLAAGLFFGVRGIVRQGEQLVVPVIVLPYSRS